MQAPSLFKRVPAQFPLGRKCKIAFVGEAPSDHELLHGFPLVGPAGRTFDQLLRVSGLASDGESYPIPSSARRVGKMINARAPYLITNVFDEKIPGNDLKAWCGTPSEKKKWEADGYDLPIIRGRGYLRPEFRHHLARLGEELEACKPNLIVPMGATALWALTGSTDISLARGAVSRASSSVQGVKILPTFHPQYLNYNPKMFHTAVMDLTKAAGEAEFPEVRSVKRRIHIRPTLADCRAWAERLTHEPRLCCDIETAKQTITCIGFAPNAEEAYVFPFSDYEKPSRSYWASAADELEALDCVRAILESPGVKTFQNGLYDVYYIIRCWSIWPVNYSQDTRLQHHALYPELPKSLAFMGATYGQQGPWKLLNRGEKRDD